MNRIIWVDYAKTFAIFAVLVIHTHCEPAVTKLCNTVALPLFFFISGFLFSFERHKSFGKFIYKRFRQLIVPYIWINIVAYIFWVFVGRKFGDDVLSPMAWHEPLIGIALGIGPKLTHDIPLWSLVSFFMVEMIYYLAYRAVRNNIFLLAVSLLASIAMGYFNAYTNALPLTLGPVMSGLFFYTLGQMTLNNEIRLTKIFLSRKLWIIFPCLVIFIVAAELNSEVNFYICEYGSFPLFLCASATGIISIIGIGQYIGKSVDEPKLIHTISIGTLLICGFHLMVFSLIKGIGYFIFGIQPSVLTTGAIPGLLFSLTGLFLCVPIIIVIEKYFRPLTDK